MTGGEYKVWQPPERAAGTKKKEGKFIFFFFQKTFYDVCQQDNTGPTRLSVTARETFVV